MQPQLTDLTAGDALAAPCRVAAPNGDLPEPQAAGPPAALMPLILGSLQGYWRAFRERRRRDGLRVSLHELSERELRDIGLAAGDIDYIAAHRAFEALRDGTAHLWLSRGLM